ncbi:MAG: GNAT family N-acetyltransferase [Candidatus Thorarchaeota archaeon]
MSIQMRNFQWDRDFDRARRFLGEIFPIRRAYTNWVPSRLENVKYGPGGTEYLDEEDAYLKIWEVEHQIVALSYTKPSGECWLLIHPNQTAHSKEIIVWMQGRVKELSKSDEVKMTLVADDADDELISTLSSLGFAKDESDGDNQVRPLDAPIPDYSLPEGYVIRHATADDCEKYRDVQGAVFKHMQNMTRSLYDNYRSASFYHEELDVLAVVPSGEFAAFCTGRIDPVSRIAELEPVGTHPEHRKLGLGKAVILECLKRLEKHKPTAVVILGAAPWEAARRLYESVGFVNEGERHYWAKIV